MFEAFALDIQQNMAELNNKVATAQDDFTAKNLIEIDNSIFDMVQFHSNAIG